MTATVVMTSAALFKKKNTDFCHLRRQSNLLICLVAIFGLNVLIILLVSIHASDASRSIPVAATVGDRSTINTGINCITISDSDEDGNIKYISASLFVSAKFTSFIAASEEADARNLVALTRSKGLSVILLPPATQFVASPLHSLLTQCAFRHGIFNIGADDLGLSRLPLTT